MQKDGQPTTVAIAAVRKCADTMESQAQSLVRALADVAMEAPLRTTALELCARLKDTSNRVMFELALLETELREGRADAGAALRCLSGLEAAMMTVVADATDVVDQLESAAERDEAQEPAFVLVIETVGAVMQALEKAKTATDALVSGAAR